MSVITKPANCDSCHVKLATKFLGIKGTSLKADLCEECFNRIQSLPIEEGIKELMKAYLVSKYSL